MSKREDLGKPIVKIYGKVKDLVLCLVCIAIASVFFCFASIARKPLYGNGGTEFFLYCGVAIIFLIFALYYLYQFCHILVLCENGFKFFTPIGKKSYRYDECKFEAKHVYYIPYFNRVFSYGKGDAPFWRVGATEIKSADPIIKNVMIVTVHTAQKRLIISVKHLGNFSEKLQGFLLDRQKIGLDAIEYSIKRYRKFPKRFDEYLLNRTWEWDN